MCVNMSVRIHVSVGECVFAFEHMCGCSCKCVICFCVLTWVCECVFVCLCVWVCVGVCVCVCEWVFVRGCGFGFLCVGMLLQKR